MSLYLKPTAIGPGLFLCHVRAKRVAPYMERCIAVEVKVQPLLSRRNAATKRPLSLLLAVSAASPVVFFCADICISTDEALPDPTTTASCAVFFHWPPACT